MLVKQTYINILEGNKVPIPEITITSITVYLATWLPEGLTRVDGSNMKNVWTTSPMYTTRDHQTKLNQNRFFQAKFRKQLYRLPSEQLTLKQTWKILFNKAATIFIRQDIARSQKWKFQCTFQDISVDSSSARSLASQTCSNEGHRSKCSMVCGSRPHTQVTSSYPDNPISGALLCDDRSRV